MKDYSNKTVWIIGASTGIGEALAYTLAARGATLILSARSSAKLEQINTALGNKHHVIACDVGDLAGMHAAIATLMQRVDRLDSVLCMAAVYQNMVMSGADIAKIRSIIDINLGGTFNMLQAVLPVMEKQQFGQIAVCGSVAGFCGLPAGQPYSATKAAIINLAESLRAELHDKNIDIRIINPGFVATPMTAKNPFPMPMIISPEKAAEAIADGLLGKSFEIRTHGAFTVIMKLLRILPYWLYFPLVKKMV